MPHANAAPYFKKLPVGALIVTASAEEVPIDFQTNRSHALEHELAAIVANPVVLHQLLEICRRPPVPQVPRRRKQTELHVANVAGHDVELLGAHREAEFVAS